MVDKKMIVTEGTCPLCAKPARKIGEFVNDPCISHGSLVQYYSCERCRRVWEWSTTSLGVEIIDMKIRMKRIRDDLGSAS